MKLLTYNIANNSTDQIGILQGDLIFNLNTIFGNIPLIDLIQIDNYQNKILSALKNKKAKIQLTGFSGSSFAVVSSQVIKNDSNPHLFIFREKESASYFINDIEELLKKDISFFPEVNNINKLDLKNLKLNIF